MSSFSIRLLCAAKTQTQPINLAIAHSLNHTLASNSLYLGNRPQSPEESAEAISTRLSNCVNLQELNQIYAQIIRTRMLDFNSAPFHWNNIIRSYTRLDAPAKALRIYVSMNQAGTLPDSYTLPIVLKAVNQMFAVAIGRQLHSVAIKVGLQSHEFCESGFICLYAKVGEFEDGRKMFDENPDRKLGSWNALIAGLCQGGRAREVIEVFMEMMACGFEPNDVTMVSVTSACGSLGDLSLALRLHKYVYQAKNDEKSDIMMLNSLIDMYGKCGRMDLACKVFSRIDQKNVTSWTSIIVGYAMHGRVNEAIDCFHRMRQAAVTPNHVTFVGLLSACVHGGKVREGRYYFDMMRNVYGLMPKLQHYGCMVDMLGRVGLLDEARETVEGMPMKANTIIWGSLMNACEKYGNIEMGEWVAKHLIELEPWNDGAFVVLSNIYASKGLWQEVEKKNMQLLARCYLQNNQAYSAYHILKGTQMAQSRYLFAISCFQMDHLNEAEAALFPANEPSAEVPNGAPGHYLLGLIYRYTERRSNAVYHFKQALSIDPFLWAAYEELCVLGAAEDANSVFGEGAAIFLQKQYKNCASASQNVAAFSEDCNLVSSRILSSEDVNPRQLRHVQGNNQRDIPGTCNGAAAVGGIASQPQNGGASNSSFYNTPSPMAMKLSAVAPPPLCRNAQFNGPNPATGSDNLLKATVYSNTQAPRRKFVDEGKLRKISGRLFSDSGPRRSTRLATETGANSHASATLAGNGTSNSTKYQGSSKLSSMSLRSVPVRKGQSWANENCDEEVRNEAVDDSCGSTTLSNSSSLPSVDTRFLDQEGTMMPIAGVIISVSRFIAGASEILSLLRALGEGYRLSCIFRCQDALDAYMKLPHKHYNTGWVLCQVGKAYFELVDYFEADRAFSLARQLSPYALEGLDIYSTVLYHLKEDMKLSYLAQELISTDRLAPQSWCAMGNCYSLQKDHETALKNFQRAVQLNSRFAYAHTLCGHEYVALEDFNNGIKSYQNALRIDIRHYNSWYGLGMVYLRQEKFEFSEHHFHMALQINQRSSVIMTYLGMALHALKRSVDALEMMERAISTDRKNPLPIYQKANILVSLEMFDEALEVLEELKEHVPRESSVYALMGNIYKRHNMHDKAMFHFDLALDLKPSAADVATIKAAIEKLRVPDELEEM